jgi:CRISPR/Cas system CSM-associated protein Csm3 (group 7 of RAMP superfamily)
MPDLRIALTVTAESAMSVGAAGSAGTLADKSILRDSYHRPIIPGSQVKGRLRHAGEALAQSLNLPVQHHFDDDDEQNDNIIRQIFGSPQVPSPLRFADLVCDIPETAGRGPGISQIRPSVTINRRRGIAEDQRLLLQEVTRPGLLFFSERAITGKLEHVTQVALLWAALKLTERWGGAKSRGLGWCRLEAQVYWDGQQPMDDVELAQALRGLTQG